MPSSDFDLEATHHFQSGGRIEPVPTGYPQIHREQADWQAAIVQTYAKEMGRRCSLPRIRAMFCELLFLRLFRRRDEFTFKNEVAVIRR